MLNLGILLAKAVKGMGKPRSRLAWLTAVTLAGYWIALFGATHYPRIVLPSVEHGDKLAHFAAYAGLAFLFATSLAARRWSWWSIALVTMAVAAGYGAIDEVSQKFVPGRTADPYDWLADVTGAAIGLLLFVPAYPVMRRLRNWFLRTETLQQATS